MAYLNQRAIGEDGKPLPTHVEKWLWQIHISYTGTMSIKHKKFKCQIKYSEHKKPSIMLPYNCFLTSEEASDELNRMLNEDYEKIT